MQLEIHSQFNSLQNEEYGESEQSLSIPHFAEWCEPDQQPASNLSVYHPARLLAPEDFGLMSMAISRIALLIHSRELGTVATIISERPSLSSCPVSLL